jgi:hypothetical protein
MTLHLRAAPEITRIWVLGGTGKVGRQVSRLLEYQRVDEVVTLSRRAPTTGAQAKWPRHVQLDLKQPDAALPFRRGERVINLTEQTPPSLVARTVRHGAVFIDSSASPAYVQTLRRAAAEAVGPGYLVDCVGMAPGLTNMMAHRVANRNPMTRRLEIAVELGLGKHAGLAATEWVLRSLSHSYDASIDGAVRNLRPGQLRDRFSFHAGTPARLAVNFPFVEQSVLPGELSGPCTTVLSYLALDPPWVTAAIARLLRWGTGGFVSRNAGHAARLLLRLPPFGSTTTRVVVRGFDTDGRKTGELRFVTGDQTDATAAVVAATALAAPAPSSIGNQPLTAADVLTLEDTVAVIRAVQPEAHLDGETANAGCGSRKKPGTAPSARLTGFHPLLHSKRQ